MMKSPFEQLIEDHHDEIHRYVWRMLGIVGDRALEAHDVTQEVFVRAYHAWPRLRPGSNQRAWLYRIATNLCLDAHRSSKRQPRGVEVELDTQPTRDPGPEQVAVAAEKTDALRVLIDRLPRKQRAAVVLRHLDGLSYEDVGTALACSTESARANVYQGLKRLRAAVLEEEAW